MPQSPLLKFFLSAQNPFGFSASDFLLVGLAALLAIAFLVRARILAAAQAFSGRTIACMVLLAALPMILRLAILNSHPVPIPRVADDFSYLLLGDTLAHFRLANPMHPLHKFFEAVFVLQNPSYSSIYPIGQGLVLAFGQLVFREPWAGVLLSAGLLCACCYWMLRGWVGPNWALLGGLLAAIEFGPLSSWMNTYWGGAVSGIAGCLIFGALPRLKRSSRTRDAILLGIGLAVQLLTRPFEFVLLVPIVLFFFIPARSLIVAALVLAPAFGITLLQNKQVTGSWTTLPYQLSRYQYGIPAAFTFQPNPAPHLPLTVEQQVDYDAQAAVHGKNTDSPGSYLARLLSRIRFLRFFFLPPLYFALPAFIPALRERRYVRVVIAFAVLWIGDAFYPYFYPHYVAAATCLFLLVSVKSLEILSRLKIRNFPVGLEAATLIVVLCLAHFAFWYAVQAIGSENLLLALNGQESWDAINFGDPEGRIAIENRLTRAPGRQLVFVRYSPQHGAHEWIHNQADIDRSRIVWAIDRGSDEDETLRRYFPDRKVWLLESDAHPPKLLSW